MRIAHVVRQYLPSLGGLEEVVRNLVQQQINQGLQPYIVTLNKIFRGSDLSLPALEVIEGVTVIRIPYFGSSRYPIALSVLKHLQNADIVHVHAIDFFYDFLALTRFIHGKPLVATTHGGFFHTGFATLIKKIYFRTVTRLSSSAYQKVVASSDNDGLMFRQVVSQNKLCVIENGVDTKKFRLSAAADRQAVMIYFGRWSINKGLFETIEVLQALKSQDKSHTWRLIICGRNYDISADELMSYAHQNGVTEALTIIDNPTNEEIKRQIQQASYFICLSKHEGFGIAPIEAMSAGLYPLLSPIPPFRKLVQHTQTGTTFDTDNPAKIALEIIQQHDVGKFSRDEIVASIAAYSWEIVAKSYAEQYVKILGV